MELLYGNRQVSEVKGRKNNHPDRGLGKASISSTRIEGVFPKRHLPRGEQGYCTSVEWQTKVSERPCSVALNKSEVVRGGVKRPITDSVDGVKGAKIKKKTVNNIFRIHSGISREQVNEGFKFLKDRQYDRALSVFSQVLLSAGQLNQTDYKIKQSKIISAGIGKAAVLQELGEWQDAESCLRKMRRNFNQLRQRPMEEWDKYCDKESIEMALGSLLSKRSGDDDIVEAIEIFRTLYEGDNKYFISGNSNELDQKHKFQSGCNLAYLLSRTGNYQELQESVSLFYSLKEISCHDVDVHIGLARALGKLNSQQRYKGIEILESMLAWEEISFNKQGNDYIKVLSSLTQLGMDSGSDEYLELAAKWLAKMDGEPGAGGESQHAENKAVMRQKAKYSDINSRKEQSDRYYKKLLELTHDNLHQRIEILLGWALAKEKSGDLYEAEEKLNECCLIERQLTSKPGYLSCSPTISRALFWIHHRGPECPECLEQAEEVLRSYRKQENSRKNNHVSGAFCGNVRVESALAECLSKSTDPQKQKESEEILSALSHSGFTTKSKDLTVGHHRGQRRQSSQKKLPDANRKIPSLMSIKTKPSEWLVKLYEPGQTGSSRRQEGRNNKQCRPVNDSDGEVIRKTSGSVTFKGGSSSEASKTGVEAPKKPDRSETSTSKGNIAQTSGSVTFKGGSSSEASKTGVEAPKKPDRSETSTSKGNIAQTSGSETLSRARTTVDDKNKRSVFSEPVFDQQYSESAAVREYCPFTELPLEILVHIIRYLDVKSVWCLRNTCYLFWVAPLFEEALQVFFDSASEASRKKLIQLAWRKYSRISLPGELSRFQSLQQPDRPKQTMALFSFLIENKVFPNPVFFKSMKYPGDCASAVINDTALLPNSRFAAGFSDGTISVFDLDAPAEQSLKQTFTVPSLRGKRSAAAVQAMVTRTDGKLVTGSHDGVLRLWDLEQPPQTACVAQLHRHQTSIKRLIALSDIRIASFSSDGELMVSELTASSARCIGHTFVTTDKKKEVVDILATDKKEEVVDILALSKSHVLIKKQNRLVKKQYFFEIYHLSTKGFSKLRRMKISDWRSPVVVSDGRVMAGVLSTVCLWAWAHSTEMTASSSDHQVTASGASESGIDTTSGHGLAASLDFRLGHTSRVMVVAELKGGLIASAAHGDDMTVKIWDLKETGGTCLVSMGHFAPSFSFAQIRRLKVVIIYSKGNMGVWGPTSVKTGRYIARYENCFALSNNDEPSCIFRGCSPEGKVVFMKSTANERNCMQVWDLFGDTFRNFQA